MNKRTHFFIKIYLSHFILERVMFLVCERWAGDGDRLLYWPQVLLTIAALLPHLGWGCSTVGHWGSQALCLLLALTLASCLQLAWTALGTWLYNWLMPTCFRCSLFTLVHSWLTAQSRFNMLHLYICIPRCLARSSRNILCKETKPNYIYVYT